MAAEGMIILDGLSHDVPDNSTRNLRSAKNGYDDHDDDDDDDDDDNDDDDKDGYGKMIIKIK
jgi:hypothetical protein